MKSYLIQGIDDAVWAQIKARAALEQKPLYQAIEEALRMYAEWKPPHSVSVPKRAAAAKRISERIKREAT